MANTNIPHVQLVNTFNEWRAATNDLIEDRNILRNAHYLKDNGTFTILANTSNIVPLLTVGNSGNGNVSIANYLTVGTINLRGNSSVFVDSFVEKAQGNVMTYNVTTKELMTTNITYSSIGITAAPNNSVQTNVSGRLYGDDNFIWIPSQANIVIGNTSSTNVFANGEVWIGKQWNGTAVPHDSAGRIRFSFDEPGSTDDGSGYWYSNTKPTTSFYGFQAYSKGTLVITNEEFRGAQAIVLMDSLNEPYFDPISNTSANGTIFGISTYYPNTATIGGSSVYRYPTTGLESGWAPALDLRSNSFFVHTVANKTEQNVLAYNVITKEITYTNFTGSGISNIAVLANSAGSVNANGLNFVNTTTVTVSTGASSTAGNANISFSVSGAGLTLKSVNEFLHTNTNVGAANTVNLANANWFAMTLTGSSGNRQFTFTNAPSSGTIYSHNMIIIQDGTGGKTPTWGNTIYWAGGLVPPATTTASARDIWTFTTYDGGSTYIGTLSVKNAS